MSKLRIHELAKEINVNNKDIIDTLKSKGVDVKSHMSSVDADQISMLKKHYGKGGSSAPVAKTEPVKSAPKAEAKAPKTEAPAAKPAQAEGEKKVMRVFNPQNSQDNRGQGGYNNNRPQGDRPYNNNRPQGDRPYNNNRPQGDRPYNNNRPQGDRPYNNNRPQGDRPYNNNRPQGDRPYNNRPYGDRPQGDRPYNNNRPQGDRPYNNNRPQGDRPYNNRPYGDRPQGQGGYNNNRPQGDRPYNNRPYGDRPQGQGGYNNNRPQGDRPYNNRPYGDRPQGQGGYNNNRPGGQGGYNNNRPGGQGGYNNNRPGGQGGYNNRPGGQGGYNNNRPGGQGGYGNNRNDGPAKPASILSEQKASRTKSSKADFNKRKNYNDKRQDKPQKDAKGRPIAPVQRPQRKVEVVEKIKMITLPEVLTIGELAEKMKIVSSTIIKKMFLEGKIVTVNHELTYEQAEEIALEYEILCEKEVVVDVIEELLKEAEEDETTMAKRPPVICVMGHVDHGKTSLLDAIRKTNVTDKEAGGITQHIGAYTTQVGDEIVTFLDTPGHEAFTSMRMRGANSTDIAILVVAADDGVMPQTIEAISHAKAAGIEIIVAVNKIDKEGANIDRVKQELSEHEIISEDWGGTVPFVPVSAKMGQGIDDLLEMVVLTAEVLELKANPERKARGLVIEAQLDKGKGVVATVLVQKGTLKVGDAIAAGSAFGRVRAMMDHKGRRVTEAGPSIPVEILGLNAVPNAGEVFVACENDKEARMFGETFISQNRMKMLDENRSKSISLDDIFGQIKEGELKELPIIVKADVQGSVEAMKQSLQKITNDEVVVKVIHGGVGAINESDVNLASASSAIIIGFNVRPDMTAKDTAEREGVDLRTYDVIYAAIEDIERAMTGMLAAVYEEKVLGHAEIRQIFKASGIGNIAGSYVLDGIFERGCSVRITRGKDEIYDGPLASLKRFKDDVKEVKAGYECGFVFEKFNDVQEEDKVEAYKMVEVPRDQVAKAKAKAKKEKEKKESESK